MLVIHPKDRTTAMLAELYNGQIFRLIDRSYSRSEISKILNHVPRHERIMLLGHGSERGLFSRENDNQEDFDSLVVYHPHAYHLRRHGADIVAVWCNADQFARKEGLHGLFSGMIISEMKEAQDFGVETTLEELKAENVKFARRLRKLLDDNVSLRDVPKLMLEADDAHTPLTTFNYKNFYYL